MLNPTFALTPLEATLVVVIVEFVLLVVVVPVVAPSMFTVPLDRLRLPANKTP